tara:strand:- start:4685 stop:7651 length:2967 start_codon:yes stop_codon:yes gene_type:complete
MEHYNWNEIEKNWQKYWAENKIYHVEEDPEKEKYYVLDMFPYPSGAGLHVGHPLGYIASDIYARYKRLKGFNVLHPMGYDSFGLPAEQYAIQTGQHPAVTTEKNIARYRQQLDKIGFSFDWDREVRTSDPKYYKWTQWIFIQLFNSWYNKKTDKAEKIDTLVAVFEKEGNANVDAETTQQEVFTAEQWQAFSESEKQEILLNYRLAYISESMVNWCPALGTVLANDEVKDGVSERGGHPVVQKKMKQWSLRITAYAQRLLDGLEKIDWSESIKEIQRNWIGRSEGALVDFLLKDNEGNIRVFTTRPDTIFGVSFMVLAPEHPLVEQITTDEYKNDVIAYQEETAKRSERERLADVERVSGQFTGAYAIHPFTGEEIPVWISDYVLYGYGTGAVMAVPAGDSRDHRFAKHFGLTIKPIFKDIDVTEQAYEGKDAELINSDFLNGLKGKKAIDKAIEEIKKRGIGERKINYRLRDAIFSRQRYWGEPIPVYYKDGVPYVMDEKDLPLELPEVDKFLPTEKGEPPLARAKNWTYNGYPLETNTMPGFAGSSWYFMRYTDPKNDKMFASPEKLNYWQNVDLYMGGAEHATGHLLYARFWTKVLYDLGYVPYDEPFQKMINQGMIQGNSALIFRVYGGKYTINNFINYPKYLDFIIEDGEIRDGIGEIFWPIIFVSSGLINKIDDFTKEKIAKSIINRISKKFNIDINDIKLDIDNIKLIPIHIDISLLKSNDEVDLDKLRQWRDEFKNAKFITEEDGRFLVKREVEKMSKSKYNVQTPDELVDKYGADTLRCYEMFLGPVEQHKPWDTKGIEGVNRFLKKFWRLFFNDNGFYVSDEEPTKEEWKILHRNLKKITEDIERFSFNTVVSQFMITTNELAQAKCNKRKILEPLVVALSPYAPHIAEELWHRLGHNSSVTQAAFPQYDESYLVESSHKYPVMINGKMRFTVELPLDMSKEAIEKEVLAMEQAQKWTEGKSPKKVIVVPKKIVNIVL